MSRRAQLTDLESGGVELVRAGEVVGAVVDVPEQGQHLPALGDQVPCTSQRTDELVYSFRLGSRPVRPVHPQQRTTATGTAPIEPTNN